MRCLIVCLVVAAVLVFPGHASADHRDCARQPWPGGINEATRAYLACKDIEAEEHRSGGPRFQAEQKSLQATQPPVCPLMVTVGDVWIDHYPVTVKNVGTGAALAVTISRTRTAASPLGGITTVAENVWNLPRLDPGRQETVKIHRTWDGSYSAAAGGCVNP